MNSRRRIASKLFLLVIVLAITLGPLFLSYNYYLNKKFDEKFSDQIQEIVGNTYQQQAIMDLCEIRGRVNQIKKLYSSNVNENTLLNELKYISSFQNSNNPYLKDFSITFNSSNVGAICEEILTQINAQIDFIKSSTEDT